MYKIAMLNQCSAPMTSVEAAWIILRSMKPNAKLWIELVTYLLSYTCVMGNIEVAFLAILGMKVFLNFGRC